MQSHNDGDGKIRSEFMKRLQERANAAVSKGQSQIAGGRPGEAVLEEWQTYGVHVRHLPNDEQGILRISVGGGDTPVPLNYLVFRGSHVQCVDLLRKALRALEEGPVDCGCHLVDEEDENGGGEPGVLP